jgi:hypothetical protein
VGVGVAVVHVVSGVRVVHVVPDVHVVAGVCGRVVSGVVVVPRVHVVGGVIAGPRVVARHVHRSSSVCVASQHTP